jgi:hypothetical protein
MKTGSPIAPKANFVAVSTTFVILIASLGMATVPTTSRFTHPGMLNSKAELDFVKAKIKAGAEPWASLLNRLKHSSYGNPNWTPHPLAVVQANGKDASSENEDALTAYAQALLWYYTDQEAYAQKSAEILNAWSARLANHVSTDRPTVTH